MATTISFFTATTPRYGYEFLWPMLLLFFFCVFVRERRILFQFSSRIFSDNRDFFVVLIGLLALRFYFIEHISVWLDEDFQASLAWKNYPTAAGVIEHQPPGDMIFTKIGLLISNYGVWGLRFHAAVFSALAGSTLYVLAKKFSGSRWLALLCVLFFSTHHLVFKYGFEARPISYGLFLELLFFATLYIECKMATQKDPLLLPWSASLSAITFLYLCSVGLQPGFIVVLTIGFFALVSYFRREYLSIFLRLLFGLLSFLPIQLVLLRDSPPRFTRGLSIFRFFSEFKRENFLFLNMYLMPIGYFCAIGSLGYFLWCALRRQKTELFFVYLLYISIFFPLILVPFFISHVDWTLNDYYLISILPPLFLLLAYLWGFITIGWWRRYWLPLLVPLVLFAGFAPFYAFVNKERDLAIERQDLKGAYESVRENALSTDLTLSFCLADRYCPDWAIAKRLYRLPPPSDEETISVFIYAQALRATPQPQNIFFVYNAEWSHGEPGFKNLFSTHNWAPIYKVPGNGNLALAVINFFEGPVKAGLAENKVYTEALAFLVASYDFLGDEKNKLHYLSIYKKQAHPEAQSDYLNQLLLSQKL